MSARSFSSFARLGAIAGVVALVGCADKVAPEVASKAPGAAPAAAARPPSVLAHATRGWEAGRSYAYRIALTTAVRFGRGPNAFDFDLAGTVRVATASVTNERTTLSVSLADATIVSRVPGSQPEFDGVVDRIRKSGVDLVLSGGRVQEMRVPKNELAMVVNVYREIGAALQFARSADEATRYTAEEYDTTGKYVAEYEFDGAAKLWHKRKLNYAGILASKSAPLDVPSRVVPKIVASSGDARLSPNGRPLLVKLSNEVEVSGAQAPVRSRTLMSLEATTDEPAPEALADPAPTGPQSQRIGADEPYVVPTEATALDEARIAGLDFEQVVARLEAVTEDDAKRANSGANDPEPRDRREARVRDDSRYFIALSAWFRKQPATIAKAVRRIREKSPASDVLVDALSSSSSPAAQQAIVELFSVGALPEKERNRLVMALGRTPKPTAASIAALRAVLSAAPGNQQALYGLGTFSRRLRDAGDIARASEVGDLLITQLKLAKTTSSLVTVLRAIANSGYDPALEQIVPFLTDRREPIRIASVRALQSMKAPSVDTILAERLEKDASSEVRVSAIAAAQVREPSEVLAGAVTAAAEDVSDARVRYRAVELLTRWLPRRPELRAALEKIAKNEQEGLVRARAQAAL